MKVFALNKNEYIAAIIILILGNIFPYLIESSRSQNWREPERINLKYNFKERYLQFNEDGVVWLNLSAYFPNYYYIDGGRINRPLYPSIISFTTKIIRGISVFLKYGWKSFDQQIPKKFTLIAALIFNAILYILFLMLSKGLIYAMLHLENERRLGMILVFSFPIIPFFLPRVAPDILGYFIAALIFQWMFFFANENKTIKEILVMGFCSGILMLGKAHYDLVAVMVIYWIYKQQWKIISLFSITHFIPLFIWMICVKYMGLRYYNMEVEDLHQVTWVYRNFIPADLNSKYLIVLSFINSFFWNGTRGLGVLFIPSILWVFVQFFKKNYDELAVLFLLGTVISFVFLFFVKRPHSYMIAVMLPLMTPIAAKLLAKIKSKSRLILVFAIIIITDLFIYWPTYFQFTYGKQDGYEVRNAFNQWLPQYHFNPEQFYNK